MTPTSSFLFSGIQTYVKRDDLIDPNINGNKARKFHQFIHSDEKPAMVVSHGSLQSNSLVALSHICTIKGIPFTYYTNRPQDFIVANSNQGNLKIALENNTKIVPCDPTEYKKMCAYIFEQQATRSNQIKFITEGGASSEAELGMYLLAQEILIWKNSNNISDFNVFIPSGTGSSAFFLQRHLSQTVYTTPVYKDTYFLNDAFSKFGNDIIRPTIIETSQPNKYGSLSKKLLTLIKDIELSSNVLFDRAYDPTGWQCILDNHKLFTHTPLLYIHCGGTTTNLMLESQLN